MYETIAIDVTNRSSHLARRHRTFLEGRHFIGLKGTYLVMILDGAPVLPGKALMEILNQMQKPTHSTATALDILLGHPILEYRGF